MNTYIVRFPTDATETDILNYLGDCPGVEIDVLAWAYADECPTDVPVTSDLGYDAVEEIIDRAGSFCGPLAGRVSLYDR